MEGPVTTDEALNLAKACTRTMHVPDALEEDGIQEALLAWLNAPAWNGKGVEQAYVYQRMKWALADFLGHHLRKTQLDMQPLPEDEECKWGGFAPEYHQRIELVSVINGALAQLSERDRQIVAMAMAGFPYMDISRRCRIIGPHIKQVVLKFRSILEGINGAEDTQKAPAPAGADEPVQ